MDASAGFHPENHKEEKTYEFLQVLLHRQSDAPFPCDEITEIAIEKKS